jgi:hypothetical protein
MAQTTCHIGISIYTNPPFPTQWALVLSGSPVFEGDGWCSTAAITVNGWGQVWAPIHWSPSELNPMAIFTGVVHVGKADLRMDDVKKIISCKRLPSELERFFHQSSSNAPYGTETYAILALIRLSEGGQTSIEIPQLDRIRGRAHVLQQACQRGSTYFVASLEDDNLSFGHRLRP